MSKDFGGKNLIRKTILHSLFPVVLLSADIFIENGCQKKNAVKKTEAPGAQFFQEYKYFQQFDKDNFPAANPPPTLVQLHWDFSKSRTYAYQSYTELDSRIELAGKGMKVGVHSTATELDLVRSQGNLTADVYVKDQHMSSNFDVIENSLNAKFPKNQKTDLPPDIIFGMQESGASLLEPKEHAGDLWLLFSLPERVSNPG
jgi:hypothetical protein